VATIACEQKSVRAIDMGSEFCCAGLCVTGHEGRNSVGAVSHAPAYQTRSGELEL
jgi:hypothetical protein